MNKNKITKPNANAVGAHDCARINNNKPTVNVVGAHDCARDHRGITLVALIITIIVMLILVGVSITIAINGGLFDITKKAAKGTEKEKNKEQELSSGRIKIDGIWYDSLEDYAIGNASAVQGVEDLDESNTGITYTPDGWTNGEVKVGIDASKVSSGYTLKYSTDNINWDDYTTEIPMRTNGAVYAKLIDSDGNEGEALTINVTKIDKEAPKVNTDVAKAGEETDVSIPLSINVTDGVSGISKIEWYYKKSTDPESEYANNKKIDEYKTINGKDAGETAAVTKETTLTGLASETTYNIYGVVYDVAGNSTRSPAGTSTIDITTKEPAIKPVVGDIIEYVPDTVTTAYSLPGTQSGKGTYDSSTTPYTFSSPEDQSIEQETLQWQVLKVHDNGTVDLIGTPTTSTVGFRGWLGYNNGVYLLNDICKELYSKPSKGIEARSVNIEDFEDEDNGGNWKTARNAFAGGIGYNNTKTYTDASYRWYPKLYEQENGSGINTDAVKTDGIKETNPYYGAPTTETYGQANSTGLTIKQTYYSISINEANYGKSANVLSQASYYWLASRASVGVSDSVRFVLRMTGDHHESGCMFYSSGKTFGDDVALRPVITLGSNISYSVKTLGTNGSPNTFEIVY